MLTIIVEIVSVECSVLIELQLRKNIDKILIVFRTFCVVPIFCVENHIHSLSFSSLIEDPELCLCYLASLIEDSVRMRVEGELAFVHALCRSEGARKPVLV